MSDFEHLYRLVIGRAIQWISCPQHATRFCFFSEALSHRRYFLTKQTCFYSLRFCTVLVVSCFTSVTSFLGCGPYATTPALLTWRLSFAWSGFFYSIVTSGEPLTQTVAWFFWYPDRTPEGPDSTAKSMAILVGFIGRQMH